MKTPIDVLLLEDREDDARLVVSALTAAGFAPTWRRVDCEVDFVAALARSPDLVLSDFGLPGWDAMAALTLLQASGLDAPFILVSGAIGEQAAVNALHQGASDYVPKDHLARLGGAVTRALEARQLRKEKRALEAALHLEQMEAARLLRESERRFRGLIENSWEALVLFDRDGKVTYASPTTSRLLGHAVADLIGQPAVAFVHPDDATRVGRAIEESVLQPGSLPLSARVRHKDGSYLELEGMLTNLLEDPAVGAIVVNYHDVTERNRAAVRLAQSDARFRAFMTHTPMLATLRDAEGRILYVNPAWSRWFGADRDVLGKTVHELFPEPIALRSREEDRQVLESFAPCESTREIRGADGVLRHWQVVRFPIPDASGGTLVGAMALDVTERTQAQAVLAASQEQLRVAVVAGNVGLWDWDLTTDVVYFSPEWKRQIGHEPDEIGTSPKEWESRVHPADLPGALATVDAYLGGQRPTYEVEFRFRHKDGSYRHILARGSKVLGEDGAPIRLHGAHVDVTARVELQAQLLQSQKMESIGQLAGGIAHDFNNLMTVILSTAEVAAVDLHDHDPVRAELLEIRSAAERAARLTRQLLAFSRRQPLAPTVLALGPLVDALKSMLARVIGRHIELDVSLRDSGMVRADASQLEQVVMNLVVNARDAMSDGGKLSIETCDIELDAPFVAQHPGRRLGRHVRLTVSDSGPGMDEATRRRAFEPFFTTKPDGIGTGLGLATVHGIVAQSGGTIDLQTAPGQGTTFTIHLPCIEVPVSSRERTTRPAKPPQGATILIVDDEAAIRRLAQRALEREGYRVLVASDGADALRALERHADPLDLLLTDVAMPGMTGIELAARVAELRPNARLMFASGHAHDALERLGATSAHWTLVAKPYTGAELADRVRSLLAE